MEKVIYHYQYQKMWNNIYLLWPISLCFSAILRIDLSFLYSLFSSLLDIVFIWTRSLILNTLSEMQMAITSERLHKQSVVIKQICKLFPQRRVSTWEVYETGLCACLISSIKDYEFNCWMWISNLDDYDICNFL